MPSIIVGQGPPTEVSTGENGATFTNTGPATVSYSDSQNVRDAPEGTIAPTASVTLYGSVWLYASSRADVAYALLPAVESGSATLEGLTDVDAPTAAVDGAVLAYNETTGLFEGTEQIQIAVDAKGDLLAASAPDTLVRLPVGDDDQVLVADSSETTGLRWADASSGGGATSWSPATNDLKGAAFDPAFAVAMGSNPAAGYPHFIRVGLDDPAPISDVVLLVLNTSGALTYARVGIYSEAGVLLARTADLSTGVFNSIGPKILTLTAEAGEDLPSGGGGEWVHACLLVTGTLGSLALGGLLSSPAVNIGIGAPTTDLRSAHDGAGGATALPATRPALAADPTRYFWMGVA